MHTLEVHWSEVTASRSTTVSKRETVKGCQNCIVAYRSRMEEQKRRDEQIIDSDAAPQLDPGSTNQHAESCGVAAACDALEDDTRDAEAPATSCPDDDENDGASASDQPEPHHLLDSTADETTSVRRSSEAPQQHARPAVSGDDHVEESPTTTTVHHTAEVSDADPSATPASPASPRRDEHVNNKENTNTVNSNPPCSNRKDDDNDDDFSTLLRPSNGSSSEYVAGGIRAEVSMVFEFCPTCGCVQKRCECPTTSTTRTVAVNSHTTSVAAAPSQQVRSGPHKDHAEASNKPSPDEVPTIDNQLRPSQTVENNDRREEGNQSPTTAHSPCMPEASPTSLAFDGSVYFAEADECNNENGEEEEPQQAELHHDDGANRGGQHQSLPSAKSEERREVQPRHQDPTTSNSTTTAGNAGLTSTSTSQQRQPPPPRRSELDVESAKVAAKCSRFLRSGETIVRIQSIKKTRYLITHERVLVLTDLPRLFYVDEGNVLKGSLSLSPSATRIVSTGPKSFLLKIMGGKDYNFTTTEVEHADQWVHAIQTTLLPSSS